MWYMKVLRDGVSICLFGHKEGVFLKDAYESILLNLEQLDKNSLKIEYEILLILDTPDKPTDKIASELEKMGIGIKRVFTRDLGENRNVAAINANYDKITFLDGDDMWDKDWLMRCLKKIKNKNIVLHPETIIYCGERNEIAICKSSLKFLISKRLNHENLWASSIFTKTMIVLNNKFSKKFYLRKGDFEDWKWNRVTLEKGIVHKIVKNSILYAYTSAESLSQRIIRENLK